MLEVTVPTIYAWVKRYEDNGIKGLEARPIRVESLFWIVLMKNQSARQLRKTVKVCPKHVRHGRMRLAKKPVTFIFKRFLETLVQDQCFCS